MDENAIHRTLRLLEDTYRRWTGQPLCQQKGPTPERVRWLHEYAPFMLLAHDNSRDHYFFYANLTAQRTFGYSFDEFLQLPSQRSAAPEERHEREQLIRCIEETGLHTGYAGIRARKSGELFWIRDCILWRLDDREGRSVGMGALVWPGENAVRHAAAEYIGTVPNETSMPL